MKNILAITALVILCGCQSFYSATVTVTQIRKSVLNELGIMYRAGRISEETDAKITKLDIEFIKTVRALELSLIAVKNGTGEANPTDKLLASKAVVSELIDILVPLAGSLTTDKYKSNLNKATKL